MLTYLDFYRDTVAAKTRNLNHPDLTTSRVPSEWTPTGLVNPFIHMERRWLHWGFVAEQVDAPWGDRFGDYSGGHPSVTIDDLLAELANVDAHTPEIVEQHDLTDRAAVGGQFATTADAPQLQWILLHAMQEYARHVGHIDIGREFIGGATGKEV